MPHSCSLVVTVFSEIFYRNVCYFYIQSTLFLGLIFMQFFDSFDDGFFERNN